MAENQHGDKVSLTELLAKIREDVAEAVAVRSRSDIHGPSALSLVLNEVTVETSVELQRTRSGQLGISWGLIAVGQRASSSRDAHRVVLTFKTNELKLGGGVGENPDAFGTRG
jgi:hypothetical protein